MAYLAYEEKDKELKEIANRIYENVVNHKMYITGGCGSGLCGDENYEENDHLPHDGYRESCASISMGNVLSKFILFVW